MDLPQDAAPLVAWDDFLARAGVSEDQREHREPWPGESALIVLREGSQSPEYRRPLILRPNRMGRIASGQGDRRMT